MEDMIRYVVRRPEGDYIGDLRKSPSWSYVIRKDINPTTREVRYHTPHATNMRGERVLPRNYFATYAEAEQFLKENGWRIVKLKLTEIED